MSERLDRVAEAKGLAETLSLLRGPNDRLGQNSALIAVASHALELVLREIEVSRQSVPAMTPSTTWVGSPPQPIGDTE